MYDNSTAKRYAGKGSLRFACADVPTIKTLYPRDKETIMALPYKTGSQDGIDLIKYLEIGPARVPSGGVEKTIETKSLRGFVISFAVFRRKEKPLVHPFL